MPSWKPAWLSSSASSTVNPPAGFPRGLKRQLARIKNNTAPFLDLSVREGAVCVKRVSTV